MTEPLVVALSDAQLEALASKIAERLTTSGGEERSPAPDQLLTAAEVGEMLKVSAHAVYGIADLPRVRVGRRVRYPAREVMAFIRKGRKAGR